jgi:hypothetical protein
LGTRNPAELYLGTYTGLCYECERAGVIVVETFPDGAKTLCYPPHCPSWRRDREHYVAYPDCPDCKGVGRKMISRELSRGGNYPESCKRCAEKFWIAHPKGYKMFCEC